MASYKEEWIGDLSSEWDLLNEGTYVGIWVTGGVHWGFPFYTDMASYKEEWIGIWLPGEISSMKERV